MFSSSSLPCPSPHCGCPTCHCSGSMQKLLRSPSFCPTEYRCRIWATSTSGKAAWWRQSHRRKTCKGGLKILTWSNRKSPTSDWESDTMHLTVSVSSSEDMQARDVSLRRTSSHNNLSSVSVESFSGLLTLVTSSRLNETLPFFYLSLS